MERSTFYQQRDFSDVPCSDALCNVAVSITIFQRHDFSDVRRRFQSMAKFAERFVNDVTSVRRIAISQSGLHVLPTTRL
jgi:hypothetical protein